MKRDREAGQPAADPDRAMNAPDPSPSSLSRLVDLGPLRVKAKHLVEGECSLGGDDLSVVAGGSCC